MTENKKFSKKWIIGIVLICALALTLFGVYRVSFTSSRSIEKLVDNYGIGTSLNQGKAAYLYATLADHWESHYICSGYGSSFYASTPFYVSHITLSLFLTNGTTDGSLIVTTNLTVDIYLSSAQNYSGLPVGSPFDISNPVNASSITASGYQSTGGYYYGSLQLVNFTFPSKFVLHGGTYYTMALQIDSSGHIYWDDTALYGQVGISCFNTTISGCTPFLEPSVSNGIAYGLDTPAVDCLVAMAIYGYSNN